MTKDLFLCITSDYDLRDLKYKSTITSQRKKDRVILEKFPFSTPEKIQKSSRLFLSDNRTFLPVLKNREGHRHKNGLIRHQEDFPSSDKGMENLYLSKTPKEINYMSHLDYYTSRLNSVDTLQRRRRHRENVR